MKRCDKNAYRFSRANGFRICEECHKTFRADIIDVFVKHEKMVGRCDMPIETREEFWNRVRYRPVDW